MKRKRLILTILSLVVLLSLSSSVLWCCLSGKYVETAESIRDYFMWPTYQRLPLEYYNSFGYYPRSMDEAVDFYQQTYWPNMAKKDLRAQQFLTDPIFVRDGMKHRTYSVRLNPLIIILLIPIFLGSG